VTRLHLLHCSQLHCCDDKKGCIIFACRTLESVAIAFFASHGGLMSFGGLQTKFYLACETLSF
jgi:hypothetical protein